jgi:hypothetical protein
MIKQFGSPTFLMTFTIGNLLVLTKDFEELYLQRVNENEKKKLNM